MRSWAVASLRKALRKTRLIENNILKKPPEVIMRQAKIASLWAYQGASILRARTLFRKVLEDLNGFSIDRKDLRKGDVILSYKTLPYLRKDFLSRLISIAANSPITHALITAEAGALPRLLCSNAAKNGVNISLAPPDPGEVYIVMRPKNISPEHRQNLDRILDRWNADIDLLTIYKFSELKCWIASLLGMCYSFSVCVLRYPFVARNIAEKRTGLFCSEIIDNIFKEAGILVTPRSEYGALAGPVEFFYSPYLAFSGIVMNDKDRDIVRDELVRQFDLR